MTQIRKAPSAPLRGRVSRYYGFTESAPGPVRRREGPGVHVILLLSFGDEWLIDGRRLTSFVGGLHRRQVTTEHRGHAHGMQVDLTPPAAHVLLGLPMHELAERAIPLEEVLPDGNVVERLAEAADWPARFDFLDDLLARRAANAEPPKPEVAWAWRRLCETHGRLPVGRLAEELGWSGKRIVARFREQVGLPPKAVARLLRFERAREVAALSEQPDWARIAVSCGYYDQSHLIHDFRAVTGRTPATFFQDVGPPAA